MTTKTAQELQVGDVLTTIWGVEQAEPRIVSRIRTIDLNGKTMPVMVYYSNGGCIPVRDNDLRPIVVA